MRTVTFQSVLFGVASLAFGTSDDLSHTDAAALTRFINKEVRTAVEEYPWPELTLIEERFFRDAWTATSYADGAEVYSATEDAYYRADGAAISTDVPGVSAIWEEATDLNRYVAYEQTGATKLGEILAVWDINPLVGTAALELGYSISNAGVQVVDGGTSVWVEFRRRVPAFISTVYSASTAYLTDGLTYQPTNGECYVALQATTNHEPPNATYWAKVDFPYVISSYVIQAAYAEWLKSDGQNEKVRGERAEAEVLLQRAMQQNAVTQRQTGSYAVRS